MLSDLLKLHRPDIALLCETHLGQKHKLEFDDYRVFRSDRSTNGGGTAVLVREDIHAIQRTIDLQMEHTAVEIVGDGRRLLVISLYVAGRLNDFR